MAIHQGDYRAEPCRVGNGDWNVYFGTSKHAVLHIYRQPGPDGAEAALTIVKIVLASLAASA